MPLKEMFLSYVEMQRAANATKDTNGTDDPKTVDAYQRANEQKRKVLQYIEQLEP